MADSNRLTDHIKAGLNRACKEHLPEARWEITLMPDPQGQVTAALVIWAPGVLMGTVGQAMVQIPDVCTINSTQAEEMMVNVLRAMKEARSQSLAEATPGDVVQPHQNGHKATPSGIVLP